MTSPGAKRSVGKVSVKVVPDTSKFRSELKAQLEKSIKGVSVKIPVELNTKPTLKQLAALKKKIGSTTGTAKLDVDLDGTSERLGEVSDAADAAGRSFGGMATRTAFLASAIVVLAAPALALVSTLLAGLPSLLFVAGAAFGAVALGMDGIKRAASVLAPAVDRMKASLSATFQDQLTPLFRQLIPVMAVLETGLNRVAVGLNDMFAGFVRVVASTSGMKQLEVILDQIGLFFEQIQPFVIDFTTAILGLAEAGAKSLDYLARVMNRFASQFRDVVNRLTNSDAFDQAMDGLSSVLESVLGLTLRLFEAGVNAMGTLTAPLVSLFDGLGDALVALMPALTAISSLAGNVLGQALKSLAPVIEKLTPAFEKLTEILGKLLVGAIQGLEPLLTIVAEILGSVLLRALEALEPFLEPLLHFWSELARIIGESLLAAFQLLSPMFDLVLEFVTKLLTALEPLLPKLLELVQAGFKAWLEIMQHLQPVATEFLEKALPGILDAVAELMPYIIDLVDAFIDLVPVIADVAKWIADFLLPIFREAAKVVAEVWPHIEDIIKGALDFIIGHVEFFTGLFTGDWDKMWEGLKRIGSGALDALGGIVKLGLEAVVQFFINLPLEVLRALGNLGAMLIGSGQSFVDGFIQGIKNKVQAAKNAAVDLVNQVRQFFPFSPAKEGPLSGKGYTLYSGRALIEDWAKGIEQSTPAAVRAIEDAVGSANLAADSTWHGVIDDNDFGSIGDRISDAMSGWTIEFDANGVARMVNKANRLNGRR